MLTAMRPCAAGRSTPCTRQSSSCAARVSTGSASRRATRCQAASSDKTVPKFELPPAWSKGSKIVYRGDPGYEVKAEQYATSSHNENGSMQPAAILYPRDDADIQSAISYAKQNGVGISIRTGGHQYSGASSCGGNNIQLDLSETYQDFSFDEDANLLTLGISRSLGKTNTKIRDMGIFVPHGQCSHVHVGGHAHTGGYSLIGRAFGMFGDHIMAIRVITATGKPRWISRYTRDKDEADLFYAVLGGSPGGSFAVLTHIKLRVHRKEDHPKAVGLKMALPFTQKAMTEFLQILADMAADPNLPADFDYCLTVMADSKDSSEKLEDGFTSAGTATGVAPTASRAAPAPPAGYATLKDDIANMSPLEMWGFSKEVAQDLGTAADAARGVAPAGPAGRSAGGSVNIKPTPIDDSDVKRGFIIIFAQWANLEGAKQKYDPYWLDRLADVAKPFKAIDERLATVDWYTEPEGMPNLTSQWVFSVQREFVMPYNKRTYVSTRTDLNTNGWVDFTCEQVADALDDWEDGLRVVVQIQNYGGVHSRFRNQDPTGRTAYQFRRETSVVSVMDAFHLPTAKAKKVANKWQKDNDEGHIYGEEATFSPGLDRRVFWGSWARTPAEEDLENSWKFYYNDEEQWKRLKAIKKKVDPDNIFSPNKYAVRAT